MPVEYTKEDTPEIAPTFRFQWEEAQDCYVVLYPEGMVKLSQSAGEIMKRCDGESTVAEILNDLHNDKDVYQFLEVAHGNGWIRKK